NPALISYRKLQKMVHDIKKNETGIINKFKKFQNEQVALICKTGKDTWDRLKKKPPPSVPKRDYASEHADNEEEQWSDDFDSDYENPDDHSDSEMYMVPSEETTDDSYEPHNRTSHQQPPPLNKPLPTMPSPAGSRPKKPSKPSLPAQSTASKPKLPPKPKECHDDEDNYIVPVDNDDDNYIEPTESSTSLPTRPPVNRFVKPTTKSTFPTSAKPSLPADTQEVYEVPEEEEKPSPVNRNIVPLPRNRLHPKADREANDNEESHGFNSTQESRFPAGAAPSPLPRVIKKTSNAISPAKPVLPSREALTVNEEKPTAAERRRASSQELPPPPFPSGTPKSLPPKPSTLPKVPEAANRSLGASPRHCCSSVPSTADQDAGVHSKAWYAATCDRKTAEDALYRSNKDGSFLIRKSSGQDSRQPYTLVVFYNRRVYNIPVRFIESTRQYALGREKSGEERFDSVAEIVENHQRTSLVLIDSQNNTKDSTKLKHIVRVS
ncbi:PREDICTED: B-cell linker protein, partial [Tinamus guttatus]